MKKDWNNTRVDDDDTHTVSKFSKITFEICRAFAITHSWTMMDHDMLPYLIIILFELTQLE